MTSVLGSAGGYLSYVFPTQFDFQAKRFRISPCRLMTTRLPCILSGRGRPVKSVSGPAQVRVRHCVASVSGEAMSRGRNMSATIRLRSDFDVDSLVEY